MSEREDRRRHARHECRVAMEGRRETRPGGPAETFPCRALNASEGGLLIESSLPLAAGQRLSLSLRERDRSRALDAEVEVVWARAAGGVHQAGVRFIRRREDFVV